MIKHFLTVLAFLSMAQLQAQSAPQDSVQEAMVQDLETVKYNMSIRYAPKEWKKDHLDWDLESAFENAKAKIYEDGASTSKDFQKIFLNFIKSPQDYHVNTLFYSTEWSVFPISVKNIDGKYYISSFELELSLNFADLLFLDEMDEIENPEQYNLAFSKLKIGDELIAIDGVPVKTLIKNIVNEKLGGDNSATGNALAEKVLFHHRGKYGDDVSSGTFEITVLHQDQRHPATYKLPWLHFPEWIMNKSTGKSDNSGCGSKPGALVQRYLNRDFTVRYAEDLLASNKKILKQNLLHVKSDFDEDTEESEDWREKGFLPELGEVIWETKPESDLYAYIYKNEKGRKIGYFYLPTFDYFEEGESFLNEIIEVLKHFDKETDALVFDITNNPGGNLWFTYGLLSVLTDKPLSVPSEREIIIQENVYRSAVITKLMEAFKNDNSQEESTICGYPFNQEVNQGIISYCRSIIDSWEAGKTLTDPLYAFGVEEVKPNPKMQYNKPMLVLINELDFSCADFFPAILQDNNRATLFGSRTAGAGGYVLGYSHSSRFGIAGYSLTGSIAFRPDGNPIENLGVTPDVPYKVTKRDVLENYADYIKAVNSEVEKILNAK